MTNYQILIITLVLAAANCLRMERGRGLVDLVVKVDAAMDENVCSDLLANLEKMLSEGSNTLQQVIGHPRAKLVSILIVVPRTWRNTACNKRLIGHPDPSSSYDKPDLLILNSTLEQNLQDVFRTDPPKSCGKGSNKMVVNGNNMARRNLDVNEISEWFVWNLIKMRYGVHEEIGKPGHPLFPDRFYHNGEFKPVLTTDNELIRGKWLTKNGQKCTKGLDCKFVFESDNDIQCSWASSLYYGGLDKVKRLCRKEEIAEIEAPTMHNVMCKFRPVLDLILDHPDFNNNEDNSNNMNKTPVLTVVREPWPKLVIVLDVSAKRMSNIYKWLSKALHKFITLDVLPNTRLTLVITGGGNRTRIVHASTVLDDYRGSARTRLADLIPDKFHLDARNEAVCVQCTIDFVLNQLSRHTQNLHLVLLTSANQNQRSLVSEQRLLNVIKRRNLKISAIMTTVSRSSTPFSALIDVLAQKSGGSSSLIMTHSNPLKIYTKFLENLGKVAENGREIVHKALIKTQLGYTTTGFFALPSFSSNTRFAIIVNRPEDHLIRAITFTDDKGRRFGPYTSLSSLDDVINLKRINFYNEDKAIFDENHDFLTTWQYAIDWYPGQGEGLIIVETDVNHHLSIERVWINKMVGGDVVHDDEDLLNIFAKVVNVDEVKDIELVAHVDFVPDHDGHKGRQRIAVQLSDNGDTMPDLLAGDFVFSGQLLHYPSAGRYSISIHLSASQGSLLSIKEGPVLHLVSVPKIVEPRPKRILDLNLEPKSEDLYILKFTHLKNIKSYNVYGSRRLKHLITQDEPNMHLIAEFDVDENLSNNQVISRQLSIGSEDKYVCILANSSSKMSPPSNIIDVEAVKVLRTAESVIMSTRESPGLMLIVIVAFFVVVAILLWASIWFITRHKLRRINSRPNIEREEERAVPKFSALAAGGVVYPSTPVHWSASQLLDNQNKPHYVNLTFPRRINQNEEIVNTICPLLIDRSTSPMEKMSPDLAALYGTVRRNSKLPPSVPPRPSLDALLGNKAKRSVSHV